MYRRGQRGLGVICCFLLFILVFLSLHLNVAERMLTSGHLQLGLLLFILPGAFASFISRRARVFGPLLGAMLALPLCLVIVHTLITPTRSFWQEIAWLCGAVFWTSLGSLCFLTVKILRKRREDEKKPAE
ncbi:inner membrane protein YbjM [Enterobacteriaceae bacterium H11S18]|uniref:inner membrane protein YbjM n=1 Tax=Enterobacteriaceae TaxID=543 RepID=UPI001926CA04|nr:MULTISPECIES: inner membrane protein YbjM [Enterobacteriaceae]MCT4710899.1 inner membrane protein YbjM [Dryocola clanedunensis]